MPTNTTHPGKPKYEGPSTGWFTLLHHAGEPVEYSANVQERIADTRKEKPKQERAIRLAAICLVPTARIPLPLCTAGAAYNTARAAYDEARAAYYEAEAAYGKAGAACRKAGAAYGKAGAAYDKAWAAYDKALAAYGKAGAACRKARAAYDEARAAYDTAGAACRPALNALVKEFAPDAPWNGSQLVFTKGAQS
ncbi:MAG: hypothetical protein Q7R68_10795 [Nitrospirales bacterium]|nr:hypothetical protein [Nitrospirales bacterium]